MKICLYVFFTLCPLFLVYSSDLSFKYNYELYGIDNLTDQAIISAPNGDDYFFGIENEQIVGKYKSHDSDVFLDYIPDFSYHNFDRVVEIESITFSNNREYLFFVSVSQGIESINVLFFNNENILTFNETLTLNFKLNEHISFFNIFNGKEDNAELIFCLDNSIKVIRFQNNFIEQKYINHVELEITGELRKIIKNKSENNCYILSIYNIELEINELWMLKIDKEIFYSQKLSDLIDYDDINYEIINNILIFSIANNNLKQYLNFDFDKMIVTSVILKIIEIRRGYYEINNEIIYCLSDNKNLVTFPELIHVEDIHTPKPLNNLIHKYSDELSISYENRIIDLTFNNFETKSFKTLYEYTSLVVLNNYIICAYRLFDDFIFKIYHFYDTELKELKEYKYLTNIDRINNIYIQNSFINFDTIPLFLTINENVLFESDSEPFQLNKYVYYKLNDTYFIGYGDINQ